MPAPGIVTGSNLATALFGDTTTGKYAGTKLGVFGANPGSTPKYALNLGTRDAEYRETMARLFVEIPAGTNNFLASISPEAQALARVLATGGDTAGSGGTGFIDFLLTGAQEGFAEKAQIVDTLTDNYVAFYSGEQPPLFQYSGTVLNTYQDDQRVWLFRLYREILRGTRLANRNLIARLRYDSFIVSGYLESMDQSLSGDNDHQAGQFRFSMRVQHMTVFTPSIGQPTIASTPATEISLAISEVTPSDPSTERVATITPELDAEGLPIGTPPIDEAATREALLAAGASDEDIAALMSLSREARAESDGGGAVAMSEHILTEEQYAAARMQEYATESLGEVIDEGRPSNTSGAESVTVGLQSPSRQDDGIGGLTNILGDVYGTAFGTESTDGGTFVQELPEREGLRRRGGLGGI